MATQTLAGSDVYRLLNEEVNPVLIEMINRRSVERKLFSVKTHPVSGKYYLDKAVIGGNFRLGGRPEGGYIPGFDPTATVYDKFSQMKTMETRFKRRYLYTAIDFTGPMRQAPKTSTGGFENLAQMVIKDTVDNLPEMISRKWAGTQKGILGQISSVSTSGGISTITLVPANAPATAAASLPWAGNRLFREGMVLDAVTGTSGSPNTPNPNGALRGVRGRYITDISDDGTTCTITMNGSVETDGVSSDAWVQGDLLIEYGTRSASAISSSADYEDNLYDPMGIQDCVQDGSDALMSNAYHGNALVSSYKTLQSHKIVNTNNTAWTVQMVNRLAERIAMDSMAGGESDLLYTTPSVYRSGLTAFNTTTNFAGGVGMSGHSPMRYNNVGKGEKINVGVAGVEVNTLGSTGSKTIFTSPFAPHYRMFAIQKGTLEILQEKEPGFMDDDGLTLRNTPGKDEFAVVWKWYCSGLKSNHPRKNGYITGLSGDHNNS